MFCEKNKLLLQLITSTGLLVITDNQDLFLFYDRYSGFFSQNNKCSFFNNLHLNLQKEKVVKIYHFFYYYPLTKSQLSLSQFFREYIKELVLTDLEEHPFNPFLWEIGTLHLNYVNEHTENEKIIQEMRKIHGPDFNPEPSY